MKACIMSMAIGLLFSGSIYPVAARAESEAECAIWLCLPGGFPEGCQAARSAFNNRMEKGKSPLPPFANCAVGESKGDYTTGYDRLEDCKEGFEPRQNYYGGGQYYANACVASNCGISGNSSKGQGCGAYERPVRQQPNYVKMWVDGKYLGQYWW